MICAVAMDPRFKSFASNLCTVTGVGGESARQEMVWVNVRDIAIQHWKFEEEKEYEESDAVIMSPQAVKRARTGMGSMLSLYREAAGEGQSDAAEGRSHSVQKRRDMLDAAIEHYRKIPCVDENSDPLLFWKAYDVPGSALEPLLPFAASIAAVPATEAICERLFKAGGQVLTSAPAEAHGVAS